MGQDPIVLCKPLDPKVKITSLWDKRARGSQTTQTPAPFKIQPGFKILPNVTS